MRPESAFCRSGLGATGVGFPPERAWCDRSRLSAGAGFSHMSEVCCELGFVAPPLAACEGALDGRPVSCRRAARAAADGGCSTGTVAPGAGRERHVAWRTPHPTLLHVVHANHGDEEEMNCDQLNGPYLARQMSWCCKPQPGGGRHPPKPRGCVLGD